MMTTGCKDALERIEKNDYPLSRNGENFSKRAKKYIVKAFQIGKRALIDWGIIIEEYEKYEGNHNIKHNIMVKNQYEIVHTVDNFIQDMVRKDGEFAQYAFNKKEEMFPLLLLICSKTCTQKGVDEFKKILNNGNTIENIENMMKIPGINELYFTDGISKETEKNVEDYISNILL